MMIPTGKRNRGLTLGQYSFPSLLPLHPSQVKQAFSVLDHDGDGQIGPSDLLGFFSNIVGRKLSQPEMESMISLADTNGNGAIDLSEFKSLLASLDDGIFGGSLSPSPHFSPSSSTSSLSSLSSESSALSEVFQTLDRDGDGLVCAEDLRNFMQAAGHGDVSEEELQMMVNTAMGSGKSKRKGDGVSFEDFVSLMSTGFSASSPLVPILSFLIKV